MFDKLFSPIKIKGLELSHRIIMPAMGTKFSGATSYVTQQLIDYHVARVKGGSALNMVEVSSVHTPSAPRGFLSISDDEFIPGLKSLTDAIHINGGKCGIQLWQGSLAVGTDQMAQIFVVSDTPVSEDMTLPAITHEEIDEVVKCYGRAARRAVEAGFDCVEFHCAHTYLPHSFLSGGINMRTDEYGGSFENRAKFPLACIREIRKNIPDSMPLFMRIGAQDDDLEGGLTIEEVIRFCKLAKDAGVDVLDISRGNFLGAGLKYEVPPVDLPQGFNIDNAARIRNETGMITVGVGRINTPQLAERILEDDKVDMVVMGRAQLADPDFCNKARSGDIQDINYCIGCDQGCYDGFENQDVPFITCLRNPAVGREAECELIPAEKPETVLIAGGGAAGLEAAIVLKQRGHNPILCEKSDSLGGQFKLAGVAPRKNEMLQAAVAMGDKAQRLGVDIRMNTEVTPQMIEELKPHTFINAIGSVPIIPAFPGADLEIVCDSHDVLAGKVQPSGRVVVIGGGMVGAETAEYLATKGCEVTILEMLPEICADMGSCRKICTMENIYAAGINMETGVTVQEICRDRVVAKRGEETVEFFCDAAVIAIGAKSRDTSAFRQACYDNGVAYYEIGDAGMARRALNAIHEGFDVALKFDKAEEHAYALKPRKVVFLTGSTGTMGQETLKQLLDRSNRFVTRVLVRPSEKNKRLMKKYRCPSLEVVWGDLKDYSTVKKCVDGADYVLHIGAMVSPAADAYPEETLRTNIGSTLNIIKAIKAQPDPDKVHFAYVGTVAMTGSRLEPVHFGRVGDPIFPSYFDVYALSKVFSEMAVFESGLKHWVSIRQTAQHPSAEGAEEMPIIFHEPENCVLEWSTSIESGICMANLCEDWVDESFWRKAYNLSSGEGYRMTTWQLSDLMTEPMGMKFADINEPELIAHFNFHGQYFTDSKTLDDYLHFRCIPADQYWAGIQDEMVRMMRNPFIVSMLPDMEASIAHNHEIASKPMGPIWMLENNKEDWIRAFFGSREAMQNKHSFDLHIPSQEPSYLDHGYDEAKGIENLDAEDLKHAAEFRGGEYLSNEQPDDIYTPVEWRCGCGHTFKLSVNAVLHGGHWCPECLHHSWPYPKIAKLSKFFAQVWNPQHPEDVDYEEIPMEYSAYDVAEELREKLNSIE